MNIKKSISILFILMITIFPALAYQNIGSLDIRDGSSWNIGGGYYIMVEGVDYLGRQAFISIWNEGEMLKEELLQSGEKFEYRNSASTLIVSMKLSLVFRGQRGVSAASQISISGTEKQATHPHPRKHLHPRQQPSP